MLDIKTKNLPKKPGVYLMKDVDNTVIYVGKAKVLKNRVSQYFQNSKSHSPKVRVMVSNIHDLEYIITDSEVEALVLECTLIKKYRPKYNVLLKDDKSYPYIKITNEEYPRILVARNIEKDGAKYFGPYISMFTINEVLELIKKIFPIRSCSKILPRDIGKGRVCLNYHIKNCIAPCMGLASKEEYQKLFKDIIKFLEGKHEVLISELQERMLKYSNELAFEKAADMRDKITSIKQLETKHKILFPRPVNYDFIGLEIGAAKACIQIFFVRGGRLIGREHFLIDNEKDQKEILQGFITQFYQKSLFIPEIVFLETELEDMKLLEKWLSEKKDKKVAVRVPRRGKFFKLLQLAKENAKDVMKNETKIIEELQITLKLEKPPFRMEAYDISSIQGTNITGAMVVYEDGKPKNSEYRKFRLKYTNNDYDNMREVLIRRFRRYLDNDPKFNKKPDLILMDGGRGHVKVAIDVLKSLELEEIPVFGMFKDDKHRTKGIVSSEGEILISSEILNFVTRVQDEVHRVAISYHRALRGGINSELEDIPYVGKARRTSLLKYFKSISAIKAATIEQLESVEGIPKSVAKKIYEYFNHSN